MVQNTVRDTAGTLVQFIPAGQTNLLTVPGVSSVSFPELTADSREKTTFSSGNTKEFSPGLIDPGNVTMSTLYNPSHVSSIELLRALNNRLTFSWLLTSPEVQIVQRSESGRTVAIAVTGIPTFVGGAPNLNTSGVGVGVAINAGSTSSSINYLVALVSDSGEPTRLTLVNGQFPGSAVAAAVYSIVQPSLTVAFTGFLTSYTPSAETDANMTAEIAVKVTGAPVYTIVA